MKNTRAIKIVIKKKKTKTKKTKGNKTDEDTKANGEGT